MLLPHTELIIHTEKRLLRKQREKMSSFIVEGEINVRESMSANRKTIRVRFLKNKMFWIPFNVFFPTGTNINTDFVSFNATKSSF